MKTTRTDGDQAEYSSFVVPAKGKYNHLIQDGIELKPIQWTNKRGEEQKGSVLSIPVVICDMGIDHEGDRWTVDIFANDFGEQQVADVVGFSSPELYSHVAEKFPGDDVSWFDQSVVELLMARLPGKAINIDIGHRKSKRDGKEYTNPVMNGCSKATVAGSGNDTPVSSASDDEFA